MTQCYQTPEYISIGCNSGFMVYIPHLFANTSRDYRSFNDVVTWLGYATRASFPFYSLNESELSKTSECVTCQRTKGI
jgi:hypothetical protein